MPARRRDGARRDIDVDDRQWDVERIAAALALRGPGIGIGMQPVMHVDRAQAVAANVGIRCEQMQKDSRIQAAAEA